MSRSKNICQAVVQALYHIHGKGVVHGDVRASNIICRTSMESSCDESVAFVDLSASGRFTHMQGCNSTFIGEYIGARYSPGMRLPPEAYFKLRDNFLDSSEQKAFSRYWKKSLSSPIADKWSMKPIKGRKGNYIPRVFDIEAVNMDGSVIPRKREELPYSLLLASPLVDIWALGVLFLEMLVDGGNLITEASRHYGMDENLALWRMEDIQVCCWSMNRIEDMREYYICSF